MPIATFGWIPQVDPEAEINFRVRAAQFGDGYSQEVADGINNRTRSYPLTFVCNDDDATDIMAFFDAHQGFAAFNWTPPLNTVAALFKVVTYHHIPHGAGWNTITATFVEKFSP
jgi:phage-related protein